MSIAAKFIDGPWGGRQVFIDRVTEEYRVVLPNPPLLTLSRAAHGEVAYAAAVYILWDNWPVRYIFDHIEKA